MFNHKRTKIIATLGPATSDLSSIKQLIQAGVNMIRLNFSHGSAQDHIDRADLVRQACEALKTEVGILADLQGPKIRIARFQSGSVELDMGQEFILDAELASGVGDETQVGIDYKDLPNDVCANDILLLDDGRLQFKVSHIDDAKIICQVLVGGKLSNNKGINRLGGGLSADALTDKDKQDLKTVAQLDVAYIAISFPRSAQDMHQARDLLQAENIDAGLIAKIERAEAVNMIDEIIEASDAIMVARGDLGVEIGDAELPAVQKHIIQRTRDLNKPVITATQMMESMIENSIPTRAEVFDVSNAVLDYTDAVMLSAETATGAHPIAVVEAMSRICQGAEKQSATRISSHRIESHFQRVDEAIAMSAMYAANHMSIKAIITITESGFTPLLMSRIRSAIPIYALSQHSKTRRKMCLYRNVYSIDFDVTKIEPAYVNQRAIAELAQHGIVEEGDYVIISGGDLVGIHGGTNLMKIVKVGSVC